MADESLKVGIPMKRLGFVFVAFAWSIDQMTKSLALKGLWPPYSNGVEVLPILNLRLGFNSGISFGLFAENAAEAVWLLVTFKILVVALLALWLWRTQRPIESVALGAIIGGALGNTFDRIRHGAVVDFIDLHAAGWHWPTFNMADVFIVAGAAGLIWAGIRTGPGARSHLSTR